MCLAGNYVCWQPNRWLVTVQHNHRKWHPLLYGEIHTILCSISNAAIVYVFQITKFALEVQDSVSQRPNLSVYLLTSTFLCFNSEITKSFSSYIALSQLDSTQVTPPVAALENRQQLNHTSVCSFPMLGDFFFQAPTTNETRNPQPLGTAHSTDQAPTHGRTCPATPSTGNPDQTEADASNHALPRSISPQPATTGTRETIRQHPPSPAASPVKSSRSFPTLGFSPGSFLPVPPAADDDPIARRGHARDANQRTGSLTRGSARIWVAPPQQRRGGEGAGGGGNDFISSVKKIFLIRIG